MLWGVVGLLAPAEAVMAAHDVEWVFGNSGSQSYILDSFLPEASNLGTTGAEDPPLNLELGRRYQVTVTNATFHPLQIIAKGGLATEDAVLLSMTGNGSFDSDPGVDMQNGSGSITFTFTQALYSAMINQDHRPGYRCGIHSVDMRGDFIVQGAPSTEVIPVGDVNTDHALGLGDVIVAQQVLTGMNPASIFTGYPHAAIDIDGKSRIGMAEGLYVLENLAGLRDPVLLPVFMTGTQPGTAGTVSAVTVCVVCHNNFVTVQQHPICTRSGRLT